MQTPKADPPGHGKARQSAAMLSLALMLLGTGCKSDSASSKSAKQDGSDTACSMPPPGPTTANGCMCGCGWYYCSEGEWKLMVRLGHCSDAGRSPRCGNGVKELSETCDDGNRIAGDGCSGGCQTETNWKCPDDQPCVRLSECGDGTVTSDEICDDGDTVGGDGCSADCRAIEPGWHCRVPGRPCSPVCADGQVGGNTCVSPALDAGAVCGDGIVGLGEECDDGSDPNASLRNDDAIYGGCTTTCRLGPYCGDGMVNGDEECDLAVRNGGGYGSGGCTLACTKAHFCGDGIVDGDQGEDCDTGPSNGQVGVLCDSDCRLVVVQL